MRRGLILLTTAALLSGVLATGAPPAPAEALPNAVRSASAPVPPAAATARPVVANFGGGGGTTDILWYAPGSAPDYLWTSNGDGTFTSRPLTINGTYTPIPGDHDANGTTDILWYAPGTTTDYLWTSNANGTYTSRPHTINGTYTPIPGHYDDAGPPLPPGVPDAVARSRRTDRSRAPRLSVQVVASGLNVPWQVGFLPDGTMLWTERPGTIRARLTDGTVRTLAADMSDLFASGESGLLGLAVDPAFAQNRRVYTCQAHGASASREVQVIAWTVNAGVTSLARVADPLVDDLVRNDSGRHGGCRLRIAADGALWITTGDGAFSGTSQDLTSLGGKVLRVNRFTGAGASGNPFAGSGNADTRRVYTYGHRNVQGLAFRPGSNEPWAVEHGPTRDDEVNRLVPGGNYGWDPGPGYDESVPMTDTTKFPNAVRARWSSGFPTIATSGADFLRGSAWRAWEGALAVATLKDRSLRIMFFDGAGQFTGQVVPGSLDGPFGRLRDATIGPDGNLYLTTSNGVNDRILRVVPS